MLKCSMETDTNALEGRGADNTNIFMSDHPWLKNLPD